MLTPITKDNLNLINGADFLAYAKHYAHIETQTLDNIAQFGLPFLVEKDIEKENQSYQLRLKELGAIFANNGKSIHTKWISSACIACRTGEGSYTTFISLKCHRDCYFCFNPNQENYAYFQQHKRAAQDEINELSQLGSKLTHVALTGGEPLIHKEETIHFFSNLQEKMPHAHARLYTAGDPLTEATAQALRDAGLQEIRFSIKIDDTEEKQQKVLDRIAIAKQYIPTVMVEMPVLPNTLPQMQDLLFKLEALNVDGINLLEFCFPLCNVSAYQQQQFQLKYPPYEVFYNYWYAGGLAIANSENICLQLLLFALEKKLNMGVHYCSLENKHTGQVYQQNQHYQCDALTVFSTRDYFLKTAKVFGKSAISHVQTILNKNQQPSYFDKTYNFLQFSPTNIPLLQTYQDELCIASSIAETTEDGDILIKEVKLAWTTPQQFQLSDIFKDEPK